MIVQPAASETMTRRWWLVALLSLTATASYLSRVNVSVAAVQMMPELGLTQQAMGRVFSAFVLGYALFQIPSGMLSDRFGATRVLGIAALAWVASVAGIAAATSGIALLAMRFLLGIAEAPTFPASARAVFSWIPLEKRATANGLVIAGIGLGSAIAPGLITFLMVRWGWRIALLASTIPALIAGLSWLFVRSPASAETRGEAHASRRTGIPMSKEFLLLTLSYTLQGYVGYVFVFWFYTYLVDVRHFDLMRSAVIGTLPWVLSIFSIPLGGFVFDRMKRWRRLVPMVGLGGSGILTAVGAYTLNPYVAAVSLAFATALVMCVEGAFWSTMTHIAGPRSGAAGGFMNTGSNIGGLISPALTPVLAAALGWEAALLVSAALAVIGAALWLGINPPESAVPA